MKERGKGFIAGMLVSAVLAGTIGTAAATIGSRTVKADYADIKITLNGSQITPKDATGATVEPFSVNGTTYLPVRAVANALGVDVDWNGDTSTVEMKSNSFLDKETSSYAWDVVLYADALKSLLSSSALCVANGDGSATEIQEISGHFYDELLPALENLRLRICNNTTYELYMAVFDFTGNAEDTIYHFAEYEANPSTGTSNSYYNYLEIANNSYFEVMDKVGNYYRQAT